ncbi:hypothetical protein SCHPADRAFT_577399 [Schizopora paradoxa]|uniref:Transmembrane protein n=1 Tax=Schizopora paradoxa TaxID=27342 RepID=A0A0H2RBK8_9AGAM|nr:hypothetical protein SCHPADRAFT_577399 [Schizopora paradoxa]
MQDEATPAVRSRLLQDVEPRSLLLPTKRKRFFGLALEVGLVVVGVGLMIAHHLFYTYLNNKSLGTATVELPPLLQDQRNVNFLGTAIASVARIVLSMVVGKAFVQLLWESLRSRIYKIGQIDSLIKCGQSPFNPSAFRAATSSLSLFLISLVAAAMSLVVVFAPGSLTVITESQRTTPCVVPSVPSINDPIFDDIGNRLEDSTMAIYASNTFFPPFRVDPAVACGSGAPTCSYNVSFVGVSFDCTDVTSTTNLSTLLQPQDPPSNAPFLIWNFDRPDLADATFTFLSQDLVKGETQATNCTIYNATYEVGVLLDEVGASVNVWSVVPNATLGDGDTSFMSLYSHAALDWLVGDVFAGPNGNFNASQSGDIRVQDNSFFVITTDGNHTWVGSVANFLESYMQNVSLSLLSGNIYYGISNDTATNLENLNTTCAYTLAVYSYRPTRLFITYGAALGAAAVIGMLGCWLILWNGTENEPLFSQVIRISLNDALFRISEKVDDATPVRLGRDSSDTPGILLPVASINDRVDLMDSYTLLNPKEGFDESERPHNSLFDV